MRGALRLARAAILSGVGAGVASACQCADYLADRGMSSEELMPARFERAKIVARGTVVALRVGTDVHAMPPALAADAGNFASMTSAGRAAVADFKVDEATKGDVSGTVHILSGLGAGDCGLAGAFLSSIAFNASIPLGLSPIPDRPRHYYADICSYLATHPRGRRLTAHDTPCAASAGNQSAAARQPVPATGRLAAKSRPMRV